MRSGRDAEHGLPRAVDSDRLEAQTPPAAFDRAESVQGRFNSGQCGSQGAPAYSTAGVHLGL